MQVKSYRFMYDSVQTSLRDERTAEDLVPVDHRQLAGNDESSVGVSVIDDLHIPEHTHPGIVSVYLDSKDSDLM